MVNATSPGGFGSSASWYKFLPSSCSANSGSVSCSVLRCDPKSLYKLLGVIGKYSCKWLEHVGTIVRTPVIWNEYTHVYIYIQTHMCYIYIDIITDTHIYIYIRIYNGTTQCRGLTKQACLGAKTKPHCCLEKKE